MAGFAVFACSVFGCTPHDPGVQPPPESAGRLRLRLRWEHRDLNGAALAVAQDEDDELQLVLEKDLELEMTHRHVKYNDRGMKALLLQDS